MLKLLLITLCIILCLLACNHTPEDSAETASPPVTETVETEPSATPPPLSLSRKKLQKHKK